jgi:peptide/nickel transport system substrate-binding protein
MMGPEGSITVATRLNVESRHADPHQQVHGGYRTTHLNAYEGLTWRRPTDGALDGLLAKSWEISPDNESFTFTLQDDVTFWNGETMTAEDVKFSWDRAVDPENKQYTGQEMRDGVGSVSVIDESTVQFNLLKPYGGLLERLFLFAHISPKAALEAGGMDFWENPVGTGPLKFTDLQPGEYVKFEAHDDYWNPEYLSSVQSVDMQNIEDPTARTAALTSGRVDIIGRVIGPMIAEVEASSDARIVTVPGASIMVLKFDHWVDDIIADVYPILDGQEAVDKYDSPLGDMRVRRAISMAIDREKIVDTLYGGYGIPWATAMCRTSNGFNDSLEAHEYNPEMAKELLEEAGYADGFEYAYNMNAGNKDLAEAIGGYLREVGIEPELVLWDDATYRDKKLVNRGADGFRGIREDPFGCIAMGESMAMLATWYTLNPASGSFATPELDALIEKVTSTLDSDERAGYGRDAAVELYDNMGDAGLWHLDALFGVGARIESYNPGPPNSQLVRLYTVQLKK